MLKWRSPQRMASLLLDAVALERKAWSEPVDAGAISARGRLQVCIKYITEGQKKPFLRQVLPHVDVPSARSRAHVSKRCFCIAFMDCLIQHPGAIRLFGGRNADVDDTDCGVYGSVEKGLECVCRQLRGR